jgi:fluoroquinolone transport system permease protein
MSKQHFISDFRLVLRDPILLLTVLTSVIIILFLKIVFPLMSDYISSEYGFRLYNYYSIISITAISAVPIIFGSVSAILFLRDAHNKNSHTRELITTGKKDSFMWRNILSVSMSFLILLIIVFITSPVPEEGWLRNTFVAGILSLQSPFVFLFIYSLAGNRLSGFGFSKLFGIFLVVVPYGLLVHHPWNYFAFFSPFYWSSWAWVASDPIESLYYGVISVVLTIVFILILFRYRRRNLYTD